jgi:hypothetical protein
MNVWQYMPEKKANMLQHVTSCRILPLLSIVNGHSDRCKKFDVVFRYVVGMLRLFSLLRSPVFQRSEERNNEKTEFSVGDPLRIVSYSAHDETIACVQISLLNATCVELNLHITRLVHNMKTAAEYMRKKTGAKSATVFGVHFNGQELLTMALIIFYTKLLLNCYLLTHSLDRVCGFYEYQSVGGFGVLFKIGESAGCYGSCLMLSLGMALMSVFAVSIRSTI